MLNIYQSYRPYVPQYFGLTICYPFRHFITQVIHNINAIPKSNHTGKRNEFAIPFRYPMTAKRFLNLSSGCWML